MTKTELTVSLDRAQKSFVNIYEALGGDKAFADSGEKWNPSQHLVHLILSVNPLCTAFSLPGFVLSLMFGNTKQAGRSYEQLLEIYNAKLADGGKSSKPYIPKPLKIGSNKNQLIENFNDRQNLLKKRIANWDERQLDKYVLPHPLLGKLSLREIICFTIFHIRHHENAICKL